MISILMCITANLWTHKKSTAVGSEAVAKEKKQHKKIKHTIQVRGSVPELESVAINKNHLNW